MKKILLLTISMILLIGFVSCTKQENRTHGHTIIDWVDFIKLNGKTYSVSDHYILANPDAVKEVIGKVDFQVAGVVGNPKYRTKDGDAAFLPKGTEICSLWDYPDHSLVAVKDENFINGYKLYCEDDRKESYPRNYNNIPKDKINRIGIYTFDSSGSRNFLKDITDGNQIKGLISLLDRGLKAEKTDIDVTRGFYLTFYTGEAYAYKFNLYSNGNNIYWTPWDTMLLPEGIEDYFTA